MLLLLSITRCQIADCIFSSSNAIRVLPVTHTAWHFRMDSDGVMLSALILYTDKLSWDNAGSPHKKLNGCKCLHYWKMRWGGGWHSGGEINLFGTKMWGLCQRLMPSLYRDLEVMGWGRAAMMAVPSAQSRPQASNRSLGRAKTPPQEEPDKDSKSRASGLPLSSSTWVTSHHPPTLLKSILLYFCPHICSVQTFPHW